MVIMVISRELYFVKGHDDSKGQINFYFSLDGYTVNPNYVIVITKYKAKTWQCKAFMSNTKCHKCTKVQVHQRLANNVKFTRSVVHTDKLATVAVLFTVNMLTLGDLQCRLKVTGEVLVW